MLINNLLLWEVALLSVTASASRLVRKHEDDSPKPITTSCQLFTTVYVTVTEGEVNPLGTNAALYVSMPEADHTGPDVASAGNHGSQSEDKQQEKGRKNDSGHHGSQGGKIDQNGHPSGSESNGSHIGENGAHSGGSHGESDADSNNQNSHGSGSSNGGSHHSGGSNGSHNGGNDSSHNSGSNGGSPHHGNEGSNHGHPNGNGSHGNGSGNESHGAGPHGNNTSTRYHTDISGSHYSSVSTRTHSNAHGSSSQNQHSSQGTSSSSSHHHASGSTHTSSVSPSGHGSNTSHQTSGSATSHSVNPSGSGSASHQTSPGTASSHSLASSGTGTRPAGSASSHPTNPTGTSHSGGTASHPASRPSVSGTTVTSVRPSGSNSSRSVSPSGTNPHVSGSTGVSRSSRPSASASGSHISGSGVSHSVRPSGSSVSPSRSVSGTGAHQSSPSGSGVSHSTRPSASVRPSGSSVSPSGTNVSHSTRPSHSGVSHSVRPSGSGTGTRPPYPSGSGTSHSNTPSGTVLHPTSPHGTGSSTSPSASASNGPESCSAIIRKRAPAPISDPGAITVNGECTSQEVCEGRDGQAPDGQATCSHSDQVCCYVPPEIPDNSCSVVGTTAEGGLLIAQGNCVSTSQCQSMEYYSNPGVCTDEGKTCCTATDPNPNTGPETCLYDGEEGSCTSPDICQNTKRGISVSAPGICSSDTNICCLAPTPNPGAECSGYRGGNSYTETGQCKASAACTSTLRESDDPTCTPGLVCCGDPPTPPIEICEAGGRFGQCGSERTCLDTSGKEALPAYPAECTGEDDICCVQAPRVIPCQVYGVTGTCSTNEACNAIPGKLPVFGVCDGERNACCVTEADIPETCVYSGSEGTCVSEAQCNSTPGQSGITAPEVCGRDTGSSNVCCVPDPEPEPCQYSGSTGTCLSEEQCDATPGQSGITAPEVCGRGDGSSNVCCVQDPVEPEPCEYSGSTGTCLSEAQCDATPGQSGITAPEVCGRGDGSSNVCCVQDPVEPEPCEYSGSTGTCLSESQCDATPGQSGITAPEVCGRDTGSSNVCCVQDPVEPELCSYVARDQSIRGGTCRSSTECSDSSGHKEVTGVCSDAGTICCAPGPAIPENFMLEVRQIETSNCPTTTPTRFIELETSEDQGYDRGYLTITNTILYAATFQLSGTGRLEIDTGAASDAIIEAVLNGNYIFFYSSGTGSSPLVCSIQEDGSSRLDCAARNSDKFYDCGAGLLTFARAPPLVQACACRQLTLTAVPAL